MYSLEDQKKIEKAIILVSSKFAFLHDLVKPTLLHSIRVGSWLYFHAYETNIVLAGFLHDIIEDTDVTVQNINDDFGIEVANVVNANTKDATIKDKMARDEELIKRCLQEGEKASIVKAADIIDNFKYYSCQNDQSGIEYCKSNVSFFRKYFKVTYKDKIFTKLLEEVAYNKKNII